MDGEAPLAVRIRDVSKTYGGGIRTVYAAARSLGRGRKPKAAPALSGVTLDIRRGERVGLIGRNASGKSTLLKIIAGVLRPTSGSVETFGRVESMLELGIGFNPEFTGRENILLYASLLGLDRREIQRRHEEVAGFAEIGEFMDQPIKHYSSGMVLRLAFGAFVLVRPDILIIDEALAVGDIFFQQRCFDFLRGPLADATKIIVSHDPAALSALCARLIVLDRGRVDYDGPIGPGIERYLQSLHNEGARSAVSADAGQPLKPARAPAETVPWVTLAADKSSGQGTVRIVKAAVTDREGHPVTGREAGQRVVVHMLVRVAEPRAQLLFGYLLRDGTGQQVCGQNSRSLQGRDGFPLELDLPEAGDWHATLEFDWPPLKAQLYTLTLGIGEGFDAHHHVVQCWAHDCFQIAGFDPRNTVHGLFGSGLVSFRRTRMIG